MQLRAGWQWRPGSVTTTTPPPTVLRVYSAKAAATGWHPVATGAYGVPDRWAKTYPDGTPAFLILNVVSKRYAWSYELAASAPAKT